MKSIRGFTIVELLIVIVVIAILASISIVAYNGIQSRANDAALASDLRQIKSKLELYYADNATYPGYNQMVNDASLKMQISKGSYATSPGTTSNIIQCYPSSSNSATFKIIAKSKSGKAFAISSDTGSAVEYTAAWNNDATALCSANGFNANLRYYAADDTATGPWRSWTN